MVLHLLVVGREIYTSVAEVVISLLWDVVNRNIVSEVNKVIIDEIRDIFLIVTKLCYSEVVMETSNLLVYHIPDCTMRRRK